MPLRSGENADEPEASAADMKAQFAALDDEDIPPQATGGGDDPAAKDEVDDNVLDNLDRAGARFGELGRELLDE